MPIILATQEAGSGGLKPALANSSTRPYLKKPVTKIGLVEWLKVKILSLSPSTTKKKKHSISCWIHSSKIIILNWGDFALCIGLGTSGNVWRHF
jgi:hypothetical protein